METFDPVLTNKELQIICNLARASYDTPLAQARYANRAIANARENYKSKPATLRDRLNRAKG